MTRILSIAALLLISLPLSAQQKYKIGKLVFHNPGPYTQAALEAATGLHSDASLDTDGLQKADQALMDTGLFDDAQATLDGNISSIAVIFTLKPLDSSHLLPVRFANFVWWSPEELAAALEKSVPLFQGSLPEAGNLADAVEAALQSLAIAKGIASAKVTHEIVEPTTIHPIRSVTYSLASPDVRIHTVGVTGAPAELRPTFDKITASLAKRPYSEAGIADALLLPLRNSGYLGASLTSITRKPAVSADRIDVAFTAAVQPGEIYHVSSIHFAGSDLISAESFARSATIHPGDLATQKSLQETLAPIYAAYHTHGYMNAAVLSTPTLDTTAHTAGYQVTVNPGAQYTLHSVKPVGFTPQQVVAFQSAWKLQPGALYNPDYVIAFIKANVAEPAFRSTSITYTATAQPDTQLVDLVVTFHPTGQ